MWAPGERVLNDDVSGLGRVWGEGTNEGSLVKDFLAVDQFTGPGALAYSGHTMFA
jgi:hypothetical protein